MLHELVVENYAVIERVQVRFHAGLNLLTGETGSGKSIVVDALGLLFGGRADAGLLRTGAQRARVSGAFEAPAEGPLRAFIDEAGLEAEDGELLLVREIQTSGKSRSFVGGRPVTASLLKQLAPLLGDIHGQHEQQELFSPSAQLDTLEQFAGAGEIAVETAAAYRAWRACQREIEALDLQEQEKLRLADLWSFQRKEIEAGGLRAGEEADLATDRRVLQNVVKLEELARVAYQAIYEAPAAATAQLRQARRRMEEMGRIDPAFASAGESLAPAELAVEETAARLRTYLGRLEADPARLETIETRLAAIAKLKRKYGSTVEEVLAFLAEVTNNLAGLERSGERRAGLFALRDKHEEEYTTAAGRLSTKRREGARKLERRMEAELAQLAMNRAAFRVELTPCDRSESGLETVRFLISPNAGEEPRPLERIASGGELSRIALALKTCALEAGRDVPAPVRRTLVFDEVDAGIGGATAEIVGQRLKRIAQSHQVLCVTHLAQIAGFADHHYHVEKTETRGRTAAKIRELDRQQRTREIGRMLSGQRLTPEALRHAEQLLKETMRG